MQNANLSESRAQRLWRPIVDVNSVLQKNRGRFLLMYVSPQQATLFSLTVLFVYQFVINKRILCFSIFSSNQNIEPPAAAAGPYLFTCAPVCRRRGRWSLGGRFVGRPPPLPPKAKGELDLQQNSIGERQTMGICAAFAS